jgi:MFS family permease
MCRPGFFVGASVAALSYFSMSGLMVAAPVAMAEAGYSVDSSTLVIEAHMISMYLPSLFSGHLVQNLGAPMVMVLGSVLIAAGNAVLFISQDRFVFWVSMILIGVGWNFDYVGSSDELLNSIDHEAEKPRALAMFDFVALTGLSTAVLSSGFTFDGIGWEAMYTVQFPSDAVLRWVQKSQNLDAGEILHA